MKKLQFGVIGKGKLGSILMDRAEFVSINGDVTQPGTLSGHYRVVVNCAAISSIDKCQDNHATAVKVNAMGLKNLHEHYGADVLNLGSEQIYPSRLFMPTETTVPSPVNNYGITKVGAEAISNAFMGKTIRLSRSVSVHDPDISEYLNKLKFGEQIHVPIYMMRSYLTRSQVVDGIEFFAHHFDALPHIVNYGATTRFTYYKLVRDLAKVVGLNYRLVKPKWLPDTNLTPRPYFSGLDVSLAKSLGFPMYTPADTVSKLKEEYEQSLHSLTRA